MEGQYVSLEREGVARTSRRRDEKRVERCIFGGWIASCW